MRLFLVGSATFVFDTSIYVAVFHLTHVVIFSNILSGIVEKAFIYFLHYH